MKRMNLKLNGELSAASDIDGMGRFECDVDALTYGASAETVAMFSALLSDMASSDIVELHIEQNNGAEMCHLVMNFGSVNVGSASDYDAFDLIDSWILEYQPKFEPEYVEPVAGIEP